MEGENKNRYRMTQLTEQEGVARDLSSTEMLRLFLQERQQSEAELTKMGRREEGAREGVGRREMP